MTMQRFSEEALVDVAATASIRASNKATPWRKMADYDRVYVKISLGATWNASDSVQTAKLQQATSSTGAGVKDLTTSGAAKATNNYTSTGAVLSTGVEGASFIILEARAADLDKGNSFYFVRGYCATTNNTGADNVTMVQILHKRQHAQAQTDGAALTARRAYVTPKSAGGFVVPA